MKTNAFTRQPEMASQKQSFVDVVCIFCGSGYFVVLSMDQTTAFFHSEAQRFEAEIRNRKSKGGFILVSRLVLFLGSIAIGLYFFKSMPLFSLAVFVFTVILFLVLLKIETAESNAIAYLRNRILANEKEIDLLQNRYEKFNEGREFMEPGHPFVSDLDIFGRRSVFQMLNRTATWSGKKRLASWLCNPLQDVQAILNRQAVVQELSKKNEWCSHFIALGLDHQQAGADKENIQVWLNESNVYSGAFYSIISVLFPLLSLVSLGLWISGTTGYSPFVLSSLLQVITGLTHARTSNAIHDHLSRKSKMVNKYAALLSLVESESFASPALQQLQQQLCTGNTRSTDSLRQLKKIVDALDVRQNIVMASVLNTVLLWDIQVIRRTETWRAKYKAAFDQWIEVLAEFDAFISLAGHARIYPNHVFPVLESGTRNIDAVQLGHPLIPANKVVANDYTLQGKPAIDLLTGANMAGKSTFLRNIGVNLVLAMAGAPVCAKSFTFSPILLFTSLRTNDSLQENESFFYAELKRLQQLILLYEQGDTVFFLLDEILKGTNSKDQHEGSRALIQKLLTLKGKGIVATHDVELSVLEEEYPVSIRNICFEITIREDKLNFDYTLRKGVCRTMNASFLMKKMRITD
jgi:hypothetical protein